jgi:hypothetical protein
MKKALPSHCVFQGAYDMRAKDGEFDMLLAMSGRSGRVEPVAGGGAACPQPLATYRPVGEVIRVVIVLEDHDPSSLPLPPSSFSKHASFADWFESEFLVEVNGGDIVFHGLGFDGRDALAQELPEDFAE